MRQIVLQVAVRFPRHVDREELARAGALGLVEAARRYDGARGVPFERFAAQRIRGAILDAVRAADWAPRSVRAVARDLERVGQRLASTLGRAPTSEELAHAMGVTVEEVTRLQDRIHRSVVLAFDHKDAGVDRVPDTAPGPGEALETEELHAALRAAIKQLSERHQLIVIGYFLEGRSSAELARFLGVTESRVSQLRSEAVARLRDHLAETFAEALEDGPWRKRLNDDP